MESRSSPLSSALQTPREEPTQHRDIAPTALAKRIAAVAKRRDKLVALKKLRDLESEVALLEESEQGPSLTIERDATVEVQQQVARMQGTANPIGVAHLRRTLKPKDLAEYYRKTIKEHREFVCSYKIVFRLLL